MTAWLAGLWRRLPAKVRWALAGLGAVALVCLRFFLLGRRRGREQGASEELTAAAERDVERIREMAARGDDAGVQRELVSSLEDARRRRKGKR